MIKKVTPFLMYHDNVSKVFEFYSSIFKKDFKIIGSSNAPASDMGTFEIHGQIIHAYNGGEYFTFTEGFSLMIECETQDDIDYYWEKLSEGGAKSQCGWVKDKFGLSWQITPTILLKMISDKDKEKANRATQAMLKMSKIVISELEDAYNQK